MGRNSPAHVFRNLALSFFSLATLVVTGCVSTKSNVSEKVKEEEWRQLSQRMESQEAEVQRLNEDVRALRRDTAKARAEARKAMAQLKREREAKASGTSLSSLENLPGKRAATDGDEGASRADTNDLEDFDAIEHLGANGSGTARRLSGAGGEASGEKPKPAPATATQALEGDAVADSSHENLQSYFQGLHRLQSGHYEDALKSLHQFLRENPQHVYADRAQYLISRSHFMNKDYGLVIVATNLLEANYPHSFKIPDALYERAVSYEKMGQGDQARSTLSDLIKKYPSHPLAGAASNALASLSRGNPGGAFASSEAIPLIDDVQ